MMICPNPNCGATHENIRGKCPHCGADFHGYVREKRVVQPPDLGPEYRCAHGIFRHRPCPKCERSAEDCEVHGYRRSIRSVLIKGSFSKSEAEKILAAIDLI